MKRLVIGLLAIAMFAECRRAPETRAPLRTGLVTWIGYGPLYIAKEKGFFDEQHVSVDLQRIEGDVERRAAIASGNLDGIALTLDAMIVLRARGIPLRTVMAIDASNGGDGIVAVQNIKSVKDLAGHQIAFPTGLPSHFFLYSVLKSHDMHMSDIKPVVMDADQAGAAFASGKIDAAVTWEPWLSKATEVGRGHILATSRDYPQTIEDVLFFREDAIGKRRTDIDGVIKAWYNGVHYVSEHPAEAKAIMGRAFFSVSRTASGRSSRSKSAMKVIGRRLSSSMKSRSSSSGSSIPISLSWADPLGGSTNDYDLFVLNSTGTSVISSSTNIQSGVQDPLELVSATGANANLEPSPG